MPQWVSIPALRRRQKDEGFIASLRSLQRRRIMIVQRFFQYCHSFKRQVDL